MSDCVKALLCIRCQECYLFKPNATLHAVREDKNFFYIRIDMEFIASISEISAHREKMNLNQASAVDISRLVKIATDH